MGKGLKEQEEVTRATLAIRGLWILTAYGLLLIPILIFQRQLGMSRETVDTLQTIFRVLAGLEATAFAYYFLRRPR